MKRYLLTIGAVMLMIAADAQEPADALRYSWYVPGASARIKAIGGANHSLGGDITSAFTNPAGLAFFKTGDFIFTPAYQFGKTKANYLDNKTRDDNKRFTWGTTGFVVGTGKEGNLENAAFSIAYNRAADFNNQFNYRGTNYQSSYSQKYLEEINKNNIKDGNALASNYPFGSSLAFNTYWLDTIAGGTNGNFQFQSRSRNLLSSGLIQQNSVETHGGIDEIALGLAVDFNSKLMVGGSIGVPILHYKRESEFIEADATDNPNNMFDYAMVNETLKTTGAGFNLKGGLIYKPAEFVRLGLSVHSPTFYTLTDKFETSVTTDVENGTVLTDYSTDYTDDAPSEFKYTYISPYRVNGSVSFVLREIQDVRKQRGFITADVEYVNYKASSFTTADEGTQDASTKKYLDQLNDAIDNAYKGAFNFRAGAELKFTTVMVRLGGAYYGNPYKNINGEKGSKINLSGGLGYRDKGFFIDLTYVHAFNKDVHFAYRLANSPYSGATLRNTNGQALLTVGFKIS